MSCLIPGVLLTTFSLHADPEAAALAAAMQAEICAQLQLADCSQVQITGLNTGQASVGGGFGLSVTDTYQAALALADTDGDGQLSQAELAADPNSAAMVLAIQTSICDSIATCTDPQTVTITQIADVAAPGGGGDTLNVVDPNAGGQTISNSLQLGVTDTFHAHIMEADTDGDGTLSPAEMAAHPTVNAMVQAMQQSICDSIPQCSDPTTISVDGITSSAGGGRRLLMARGDEQVSLTLAQPTLQKFGTSSALVDCELTATEIAASPQATGFANAFGRAHGQSVAGLRIPGCTSVRGQVGQVLEAQRRVTMSAGHWEAAKVEGSEHYNTLAVDFAAAGCTEFALPEEQCSLLEVRTLVPETLADGSVAVRATLGVKRDQVLVLADVESPGR